MSSGCRPPSRAPEKLRGIHRLLLGEQAMFGDFTMECLGRVALVIVIMGLAAAACMPGAEIGVASSPPTRVPAADGAIELTRIPTSAEADTSTAKLPTGSPQATQTPALPSAAPNEVAPAATATAPPTAAPSSGPVSLAPLNTERPADILQEMAYYPGGGGGPNDCSDLEEEDLNQHSPHIAYQHPHWNWGVEWLDTVLLGTCGWTPEERVFISLFYNDQPLDFGGQVYADEWGSVFISLAFSMDFAPGTYQFVLNGPNGRIVHDVTLNEPSGPTLYQLIHDNNEGSDELLLTGFRPAENIRIITYAKSGGLGGQFAGWTSVQAGGNGQVMVISASTSGKGMNYAAIGELSGEAESIVANASGGHLPIAFGSVYNPQAANFPPHPASDPSACSGAATTRLAIGDVARVVADRLSVREAPGTDSATVYGTSIGKGRTVTILDGPVCSDGMLWWRGETGLITLTNGEQHNIAGWMAEESGDEWLLEPEP